MSTFRVYFNGGNQKLYEADNIVSVINHLVYELGYSVCQIIRVEGV